MPKFTIITTIGTITITADRWARDRTTENVYVYGDGEDADPVVEVDADEFVAILNGDEVADPPAEIEHFTTTTTA